MASTTRIRGARASASLKPDRHHAGQWLYGQHPRRARLGLIEATEILLRSQKFLAPHPRRARLGLIEAEEDTCPLTLCFRGIRGARASASLKRIQAAYMRAFYRCIRGARASASLKRCGRETRSAGRE